MRGFCCMYHLDIVPWYVETYGSFLPLSFTLLGKFPQFQMNSNCSAVRVRATAIMAPFLVLRTGLSTPIFLSNIFPLKMSKETYFHKKTISSYFFLNSRKCTKTVYFVCKTLADNFSGHFFVWYIPDFPNSQTSSNPPNFYQQYLALMIYWHKEHQLHKSLWLANTWIIPPYNLRDKNSTYIEISPLLLQL